MESALRDLQGRLDRVVLACAAVRSLAKERVGLSDKDLLDRVQDLDLKDGRRDGRIQRRPVECVACGRPMSPRHLKCIDCGGETLKESAFLGL